MSQAATYTPAEGTTWYHFLYGYVPGYQIAFISKPESPSDFTPQHFSHLSLLIGQIEAGEGEPFAFGILNLSRDDTQRQAGIGGLALVLTVRARQAQDHRGRPSPPFAHAVVGVDRQFSADILGDAACTFFRVFFREDGGNAVQWYCDILNNADTFQTFIPAYIERYADLPNIANSKNNSELRRVSGALTRTTIVYDDKTPFDFVLRNIAKLASALYMSNVRWTSVFVGREWPTNDSTLVRFVAKSKLTPANQSERSIPIESLPSDPAELLEILLSPHSSRPAEIRAKRSQEDEPPISGKPTPEAQSDSRAKLDDESNNDIIARHVTEPPKSALNISKSRSDSTREISNSIGSLKPIRRSYRSIFFALGVLCGVCGTLVFLRVFRPLCITISDDGSTILGGSTSPSHVSVPGLSGSNTGGSSAAQGTADPSGEGAPSSAIGSAGGKDDAGGSGGGKNHTEASSTAQPQATTTASGKQGPTKVPQKTAPSGENPAEKPAPVVEGGNAGKDPVSIATSNPQATPTAASTAAPSDSSTSSPAAPSASSTSSPAAPPSTTTAPTAKKKVGKPVKSSGPINN